MSLLRHKRWADLGIWGFAFGYFACYLPYSALTKALSKGLFDGMERPLSGFELLPASALSGLVTIFLFITVMGWWHHASHRIVAGISLPTPTRYTFVSGIFSSVVIITTTLAYTFEGVSIVFVMLLMRGGVLVIAPMIDALSGRKTRWYSWAGLLLSLLALLVAFAEKGGYTISLLCAVDIAAYLAAYFVRLRLMTRLAKSKYSDTNLRYFVEEQMIATPGMVLILVTTALLGTGAIADELRYGFGAFWNNPMLWHGLLVGILSAGTGIFGVLVLLDKRENTYCVPVNRASSILAGVGASYALTTWLGLPGPSSHELMGAALIISAIGFLSIPPLMESRAAARLSVPHPQRPS